MTTIAAIGLTGVILAGAPVIADKSEDAAVNAGRADKTSSADKQPAKRDVAVDLVTDTQFGEMEPGEALTYKIAVKNSGLEPEWVFIKATVPTATGALLQDGTNDPEVISYTVNEHWTLAKTEGDTKIYAYDELLEPDEVTTDLYDTVATPDYDLSNPDGVIMTGSMTMEDLNATLSELRFQGYGLMNTAGGTAEQRWEMVGGED